MRLATTGVERKPLVKQRPERQRRLPQARSNPELSSAVVPRASAT